MPAKPDPGSAARRRKASRPFPPSARPQSPVPAGRPRAGLAANSCDWPAKRSAMPDRRRKTRPALNLYARSTSTSLQFLHGGKTCCGLPVSLLAQRLLHERAVPMGVDLVRNILLDHTELSKSLGLTFDLVRGNHLAQFDDLRRLRGDVGRHAGELGVGIGECGGRFGELVLLLQIRPDKTLKRGAFGIDGLFRGHEHAKLGADGLRRTIFEAL